MFFSSICHCIDNFFFIYSCFFIAGFCHPFLCFTPCQTHQIHNRINKFEEHPLVCIDITDLIEKKELMDEFGVLVQSIGFKAHMKSAPMAKLKPKPNSHFSSNNGTNTSSFNDSSSLPVDELDGIFRSNVNIDKTRQSQNFFADDDIFGGPVSGSNQYGGIDLESVLNSSNNRKDKCDLNSMNSVGSNVYDDLLGSKSKSIHPVDDLFGSFGVSSIGKVEKKGSGFDDLIPGFGGVNSASIGKPSKASHSSDLNSRPSKSGSIADDDPFLIFESSVSKSDNSWPFTSSQEQDSGKVSVQSSFDAFDDFSTGWTQNVSRTDDIRTTAKRSSAGNGFENVDFLDPIFSGSVQQDHAAGSTSTTQDFLFNAFSPKENVSAVKQTSSWSSSSTHMASSSTNIGGDFISLFGDVITSSGEFHEIEGEPAERRRARLRRYMRMKERIAKALIDKNQRDYQSQYEQEEKHRLAETLDNDIRCWAAGKEGNLRALLSSLQQVLGPECGWRPVSLTDLITSDSVKKVYKKAALYVHPDKVQQRGADVQQKYVAEKVFDLLKEAWNKFCAEELR